MGLFSSKEEPPRATSTLNKPFSYSGAQIGSRLSAQNQYGNNEKQMLRMYKEVEFVTQNQQDLIYQFQGLSISDRENKQETTSACSLPQTPVIVNFNLLYELLYNDENYTVLNSNSNVYNLIPLNEYSMEFHKIKNLFTGTNKKFFKVNSIVKVYNPYLLAQYKLMKNYYIKRYGYAITEGQLFHGTRKGNIDNICKYNFDWRLKGTARGHIFGQGVSFTPISYYATHYGDKTFEKVMIVANVLIGNKCVGAKNTVIPPASYDTTTKENEHVYVKYDDNTFYPAYIIYYQGIDTSKQPRHHFLM